MRVRAGVATVGRASAGSAAIVLTNAVAAGARLLHLCGRGAGCCPLVLRRGQIVCSNPDLREGHHHAFGATAAADWHPR